MSPSKLAPGQRSRVCESLGNVGAAVSPIGSQVVFPVLSHLQNTLTCIRKRATGTKVSDTMTLGLMLNKISQLKEKLGVANGYRLVINQGEDGGQEVKHLHVHILGGEKLGGL